eukprot:6467460-Amphidinium_carterae.2
MTAATVPSRGVIGAAIGAKHRKLTAKVCSLLQHSMCEKQMASKHFDRNSLAPVFSLGLELLECSMGRVGRPRAQLSMSD